MNGESNENKNEDDNKNNSNKKLEVYMWGYLPGALPQRSPLLSPLEVKFTPLVDAGRFWTDVCGGGCGFAMAISGILFIRLIISVHFFVSHSFGKLAFFRNCWIG